jgi:hypothetical protein
MRYLPKSITLSFSITFLLLGASLACIPAAILNPTPIPTLTPISTATPSTVEWSILPLALQEDTLYTGEQRAWSFDIPSEGTILLSLEARIAWDKLAGSAHILELTVNGTPVTSEMLINKPITCTYADGRSYDYYKPIKLGSPSYWMLFYSPDYESNNVRGSKYQVLEGQAYLYMFDITKLVRQGQVNRIIASNQGEPVRDIWNKPIPLTLRQVKLLESFGE